MNNENFTPGETLIIDEYINVCEGIQFPAGGFTGKYIATVIGKKNAIYIEVYRCGSYCGHVIVPVAAVHRPKDGKLAYKNNKPKKLDKPANVEIKCIVCGALRTVIAAAAHVVKRCVECQTKLKKEKLKLHLAKLKKKNEDRQKSNN